MGPIMDQRNWDELKSKLRIKFPQLIETDFHQNKGMENNMLRMVEYKLGKTNQEMQEIIAGL
jgi:hypothetical protein